MTERESIFLQVFQYLQQMNIGIGTRIRVIDRFAFDESLVISLKKGQQFSVSKKFADNVLITY